MKTSLPNRKRVVASLLLGASTLLFFGVGIPAHEGDHEEEACSGTRSVPGNNPWNQAEEPEDWWKEVQKRHGHVGPWNVLGYRAGRAFLREANAEWGRHELVITAHIPLSTPYSCIIDGLAVGTGNSLGRLDLKAAEVATLDFLHLSARSKADGTLIVIKPNPDYLRSIENRAVGDLYELSMKCSEMKEEELFEVIRVEKRE